MSFIIGNEWSGFTPFIANHMVGLGSASFGIVIGWMVRRTFKGQDKPDAKTLGLIVAVMASTTTIGIFRVFSGSQRDLPLGVWAYPIGLLGGIFLTAVGDFVSKSDIDDEKDRLLRKAETKDVIVQHLRREQSHTISFERLRRDVGSPTWTDSYLRKVIRGHPKEILFRAMEDGSPGITLNAGG